MSRVVRRSSRIPVFSATAIQISGTSTPSRSNVTMDCFTGAVFQNCAGLSSDTPGAPRLDRHHFAFPTLKSAAMGISSGAGQLNGFREIHSHLSRGMRIGAESDGDTVLPGELDNPRAGINLAA